MERLRSALADIAAMRHDGLLTDEDTADTYTYLQVSTPGARVSFLSAIGNRACVSAYYE